MLNKNYILYGLALQLVCLLVYMCDYRCFSMDYKIRTNAFVLYAPVLPNKTYFKYIVFLEYYYKFSFISVWLYYLL